MKRAPAFLLSGLIVLFGPASCISYHQFEDRYLDPQTNIEIKPYSYAFSAKVSGESYANVDYIYVAPQGSILLNMIFYFTNQGAVDRILDLNRIPVKTESGRSIVAAMCQRYSAVNSPVTKNDQKAPFEITVVPGENLFGLTYVIDKKDPPVTLEVLGKKSIPLVYEAGELQ
jgi:hypothetical protein